MSYTLDPLPLRIVGKKVVIGYSGYRGEKKGAKITEFW